MEKREAIDVIIQAVEMAQKNGVLTLDDAVTAKTCIDSINNDENNVHERVGVLVEFINATQKAGVYTLQDSYVIYIALNELAAILKKESDDQEQAPQDTEEETESK